MKLSTQISKTDKPVSLKDAVHGVSNYLTLFAAALSTQHYNHDYDAAIKSISIGLDDLANALINFGCDQDDVKAFSKWGDYGWALNPTVTNKFFLTAPESVDEADKKMGVFCTIESITEMKDRLSSVDVCTDDINEAFACYENSQYKASAMILFSLIDCHLINKGFIGTTEEGKEYLKIGLSAVCQLKKEDEKIFKKSKFLDLLQFKLIIHSLMTLFQNGDNFEKEPPIMHRTLKDNNLKVRALRGQEN